MIKRFVQLLAATALTLGLLGPAIAQDNNNTLVIPLAEQTRLYLRELAPGYVLSVRRQAGADNASKGWGLEVLSRPITADAANLLEGRGPLLVLAGNVVDRKARVRYPQTMQVKGTAYQLKVDLHRPKVEGKGSEAVFTSGELRLTWEQK